VVLISLCISDWNWSAFSMIPRDKIKLIPGKCSKRTEISKARKYCKPSCAIFCSSSDALNSRSSKSHDSRSGQQDAATKEGRGCKSPKKQATFCDPWSWRTLWMKGIGASFFRSKSSILISGLFCFVLFCFVLFCFVLFCFVLFCFVLIWFDLICFVLFYFMFLKSMLKELTLFWRDNPRRKFLKRKMPARKEFENFHEGRLSSNFLGHLEVNWDVNGDSFSISDIIFVIQLKNIYQGIREQSQMNW